MLNWFRTSKKASIYGAFLIIFAMMVEVIVPVAHATASNEKSFLAAVCKGDSLVYIQVNLSEPSVTVDATDKQQCPLCFLVEQDAPVPHATETTAYYPPETVRHYSNQAVFSPRLFTDIAAIRAPPKTPQYC